MIMVSACLLGENCKYSGGNNKNRKVISFLKNKRIIPVCPEKLGDLTIPRNPAEIVGGDGNDVLLGKAKVLSKDGSDVTARFVLGAWKTLKTAQENQISFAIMKERSPSCGVHRIYDGSFSGRMVHGSGVCTALLRAQGINVISEEENITDDFLHVILSSPKGN